MLAHNAGWPFVAGGSQRLVDALVAALREQGGELVTGHRVTDLREFDGVPAGHPRTPAAAAPGRPTAVARRDVDH